MERRTRSDRRHGDDGPPPGWSDRRKSAERRMPEVEVVQMSDHDFADMFFGRTTVSCQVKPVATDAAATAGAADRAG